MSKNHRLETTALHGGATDRSVGSPVSPPIISSTSFYTAPDVVGFSATDSTGTPPPFYTRWGNPTINLLEERLTELEAGVGTVVFASGMSAISGLFFSQLQSGDHLIISDVCYAGASELAHLTLPRFGISVTAVDTSDTEAVAAAIRPGITRLVHIETPANPVLKLSDIKRIADIAHREGVLLSVDSTVATPIATRPLLLGADFVLHSLTKYICGHGDALGGAIIVREEKRLHDLRQGALIHHGGTISPFAAWLILRGLETLPIRMRVHEENARQVATFLQQHKAIGLVHWPGLPSHPQRELAKEQMENFSGLLSFTANGDGLGLARRLAERMKIFAYAVSLGKTKSLLFYIPTDAIVRSSFRFDNGGERRYRKLAQEGVFRVSVGLESADDLIADLEQGLGAGAGSTTLV